MYATTQFTEVPVDDSASSFAPEEDVKCHALHISRAGFVGGAERVTLTLIKGLAAHQRISMAAAPDGGLLAAATEAGASTVAIPFDRMRATWNPVSLVGYFRTWRQCIRQMVEYCETQDVDVIHAHHPVGVLYAMPAAHRLGIPVVLHVHEMLPAKFLYRIALKAAARCVDRFICVSQAARDLLTACGINDARVTDISNGVDWHFLEPVDPTPEVTGSGPHIGVFGVIEPRKGQDIFLAAAERVLERYPSAHFWIVGGLALSDKAFFLRRLETMASKSRLRGHVTFAGHQTGVSRWMAAMDIVALPSIAHESVGMVLIEAMTLGRPVVSSRIGVTSSIVRDGETGYLFPVGDAAGMGDALERLLASDRTAMGRLAAADMQARYSPTRFCEAVRAVYGTLTPIASCSAKRDPLSVSVVVPTYRRSEDLRRCLTGIYRQTTAPAQIIVVCRTDDLASMAVVDEAQAEGSDIDRAHPQTGGVVAAYNAGLDAATSEVIAFIDDDAVPAADWVERLSLSYADKRVGGVGGKDNLYRRGVKIDGAHQTVGRMQWFGRTMGYHHLGYGPPRDVDVLKGVNMSFRRLAVLTHRFDSRLRGPGAQVDCELMFCLALKRAGWRLVYDPAILVDHFTASRHDIDQRDTFHPQSLENHAHNETLAVLQHLPPLRRLAYASWAIVVGSRMVPGLLHWPRLTGLGLDQPGRRVAAALRGRWYGLQTWRGR